MQLATENLNVPFHLSGLKTYRDGVVTGLRRKGAPNAGAPNKSVLGSGGSRDYRLVQQSIQAVQTFTRRTNWAAKADPLQVDGTALQLSIALERAAHTPAAKEMTWAASIPATDLNRFKAFEGVPASPMTQAPAVFAGPELQTFAPRSAEAFVAEVHEMAHLTGRSADELLAPLATASLGDPKLDKYVSELEKIADCEVDRRQMGALIGACLDSVYVNPVRQAALWRLAADAARLGARNTTVDLATNTLTFSTDESEQPCTIEFNLRPTPTDPKGPLFLGLRVWAPGVTDPLRLKLAQLAQPCFADALATVQKELSLQTRRDSAISAADNIKSSAQELRRDVAIFSADATRHVSREQLLHHFGEYDFDWAQAKARTRRETSRTSAIQALEESISRETGHSFVFAPTAVGEASMWCINDLRRVYFFEPTLRVAVGQFGRQLEALLNTNAAPGHSFKMAAGRWTGPLTYVYDIQEYTRAGKADAPPMHFEMTFEAVGSRECDSDIDCTVRFNPPQELYPVFVRALYGDEKSEGVLSSMLDVLAEVAPKMTSRLASVVFDVNFYPQGFLHDEDSPLLLSPFHTITRDGSLVKIELDRGASLMRLLNSSEDVLNDLSALGETLESIASPAAIDYALNRSLKNIQSEAQEIIKVAKGTSPNPAQSKLCWDLAMALKTFRAHEPLNRFGKGIMRRGERRAVFQNITKLRKIITDIERSNLKRGGIPIVQKARQFQEADYALRLASIKHQRDVLLREAFDRLPTDSDAPLDPYDDDLWEELDSLALQAYDLHIAYACEAPGAYLSAGAVHLTVEGQQQHKRQKGDATVAANAVAEDVGNVAAYAARRTNTEADKRQAFGEYLLKVAKYVGRVIDGTRSVDPVNWDANFDKQAFSTSGGRKLSNTQLAQLALALRDAKKTKSPEAALKAANEVGFQSDKDVRMFCMRLLLQARRREMHALEKLSSGVSTPRWVNMAPSWPIADWAICKALKHMP